MYNLKYNITTTIYKQIFTQNYQYTIYLNEFHLSYFCFNPLSIGVCNGNTKSSVGMLQATLDNVVNRANALVAEMYLFVDLAIVFITINSYFRIKIT